MAQIDAISPEDATRVTTQLTAAAAARSGAGPALRVDTHYDAERGRLKVIVTGDIAAGASLLHMIPLVLDA